MSCSYSCDYCDYNSHTEPILLEHIESNHSNVATENNEAESPEQVYKCDECDYQSGIDYHVNSHIKDFHRADPVGLYEDLQEQENVDVD